MMATKNTKHPLAASSPCVSNHLHMRPTQGEEARKEPRTFAPSVAAPSTPTGVLGGGWWSGRETVPAGMLVGRGARGGTKNRRPCHAARSPVARQTDGRAGGALGGLR
ncbi:MAG: hypothetical protein IPL28_05860 [Chloroflexi bacterium]|nr:hypothetical protein [Chloroflexota bacterium]